MAEDISDFLERALHDLRVSRAETKALKAHIKSESVSQNELDAYAQRALILAKGELKDGRDADVLQWLFDILKVLRPPAPVRSSPSVARCAFSPGEAPRRQIQQLIGNASKWIDCCVFTITDNQLANALLDAHKRGVYIRVISDNDKRYDRGSDVLRLEDAGLHVRVDQTDAHMHHKFAIFDRETLLTGSYNWTRSAASENTENVLVTNEERFLGPFQRHFDELWESLGLN